VRDGLRKQIFCIDPLEKHNWFTRYYRYLPQNKQSRHCARPHTIPSTIPLCTKQGSRYRGRVNAPPPRAAAIPTKRSRARYACVGRVSLGVHVRGQSARDVLVRLEHIVSQKPYIYMCVCVCERTGPAMVSRCCRMVDCAVRQDRVTMYCGSAASV